MFEGARANRNLSGATSSALHSWLETYSVSRERNLMPIFSTDLLGLIQKMNVASENEKKRHHFVPVCYLNGYIGGDGKVFAYRKDEPNSPLHVRPREIAFERYYYSQPLPDGGRDNNTIENFFSTIESTWPRLVERMAQRQNIWPD